MSFALTNMNFPKKPERHQQLDRSHSVASRDNNFSWTALFSQTLKDTTRWFSSRSSTFTWKRKIIALAIGAIAAVESIEYWILMRRTEFQSERRKVKTKLNNNFERSASRRGYWISLGAVTRKDTNPSGSPNVGHVYPNIVWSFEHFVI